ncbi:glucose-6-phosphate dehydrogenase assembly protein OpcA [Tomitella fengzijianii]|uniref:Oxidoreductase n=1 Tax=Tomitella fengzijianii TaxID=2597660 RepID=A0A516X308_9ACTN|nr:glucose-6-phosphate dehydrogenase assembly protein OpcA [Tomitella fengzijianii]QDQ97438.1 oxidoreductase [Tomitella fengzijianii]
MIVDLPDTTTKNVIQRLYEVREAGGAVTLGRVLTLVVGIGDDADAERSIEAANEASREHPCRIIVVVHHAGSERTVLDAQIRVGADAGASEVVVLRLHGALSSHSDSVVTPFLLPDTPIVTWWPGNGPDVPREDPLGRIALRRITGPSTAAPRELLQRRWKGYSSGDTDLAWPAITPWRALLATAVEHPEFSPIDRAEVTGPAADPSADLLAGWLATALDVPVTRRDGAEGVALHAADATVSLLRVSETVAVLSRPGERDSRVALAHRHEWDCLAEELRRLDPDEIYEDALAGTARVTYES